jgi:hypothetical protein
MIFRVFWVFAEAISFFLTGLLIFKFVSHADQNHSVMYLDEKQVRVTDINFPAVSICPGIVLEREKSVNLDYDGIIRDLEKGLKTVRGLGNLK